ncbi:MAG: exodeoxyribonuclease VII large subunit, partial [Acutalibacteraceae bacterium]
MSAALTVSQINTYIKSIIDYDTNLKNIYVSGEISNFTNHYRTGHFYFTLKDANAAIKVVMFRTSAQRVRFNVENGMKVIIRGSISVFERDGVYQLYAEDMMPDGIGALNLAFEQLKEKLSALGMFDSEHKKPLPAFPGKIGVITSPTGAAIHDIMTVLERRYPLAEIVLEGVRVQGENAADEIVKAIEKFNRYHACDVLIVGRGGGSLEDLWAFNEEKVAYAIFESEIPIISAVGHETDFTISDFVSDVRAATPSAAAEIAVPDWREVLYTVDKMSESINNSIGAVYNGYASSLQSSEKLLSALSPELSRLCGEIR